MGQGILGCGTVTLTETEDRVQVPRGKEGDEELVSGGCRVSAWDEEGPEVDGGEGAQQCECS